MNEPALLAWVRWCERHPQAWRAGNVEIPLAAIGLTFDEADCLFDRASLADVRRAVEHAVATGEIDWARELEVIDLPSGGGSQ